MRPCAKLSVQLLRVTVLRLVVPALALLAFSPAAVAQPIQENGFLNPTFNLQLFRPAIDSKGYITLNASQVLGHKDFSFGLVGTWAGKPLVLELPAGGTDPITGMPVQNGRIFSVNHLITTQLQFAL